MLFETKGFSRKSLVNFFTGNTNAESRVAKQKATLAFAVAFATIALWACKVHCSIDFWKQHFCDCENSSGLEKSTYRSVLKAHAMPIGGRWVPTREAVVQVFFSHRSMATCCSLSETLHRMKFFSLFSQIRCLHSHILGLAENTPESVFVSQQKTNRF